MCKLIDVDTNKIHELSKIHFGENVICQSIERLGGMTNHSYKVVLDCGVYVFRIAGEGTEEIISRTDEYKNFKIAGELGIDAPVLYFEDETGMKISEYLKDAVTMSQESMKNSDNYRMAANVLSKLHNCGKDSGVAFDIFAICEDYEKFSSKNNVAMYNDYAEMRSKIIAIKEFFDKTPTKLVPSHNDPLCENWILSEGTMYLVDWEYGGMNDPMWDVADVAIEVEMDDKQEIDFLEMYLNRPTNKDDVLKFLANKVYLDFLWSLWAKTRVPFDDEMEPYAFDRYERMKVNLGKLEELMSV